MNELNSLLVFTLNGQRYALRLSAVDRVIRIAAITLLPKAPNIVLGVINVQGRVIPVINMRQRFCLPVRELSLTDQLVIAHTTRRPVALVADTVLKVIEDCAQNQFETEQILPQVEYVEGVVKLADGLILIHDLNKFLSLEEEGSLDQALNAS